MEDLLIDTLTYFNFPVIRQGSMNENENYPNDFFTFWNNDTGKKYYDNVLSTTTWYFDVNFYSADPGNVSKYLNEAAEQLEHAGFIISESGYDVASDEPTHTGKGMNVIYMQKH